MKSIFCMAILCVTVSIADAQSVEPRVIPVGQLETDTLAWDWSQGAAPSKVLVRCIRAGAKSSIEKPVEYPVNSIRLKELLPGAGTYDCLVRTWTNQEEGPASAPFPFVVTGASSAVPSNLRLQ